MSETETLKDGPVVQPSSFWSYANSKYWVDSLKWIEGILYAELEDHNGSMFTDTRIVMVPVATLIRDGSPYER
jgi:hypothetical protein